MSPRLQIPLDMLRTDYEDLFLYKIGVTSIREGYALSRAFYDYGHYIQNPDVNFEVDWLLINAMYKLAMANYRLDVRAKMFPDS